jgi:hypothetical protein
MRESIETSRWMETIYWGRIYRGEDSEGLVGIGKSKISKTNDSRIQIQKFKERGHPPIVPWGPARCALFRFRVSSRQSFFNVMLRIDIVARRSMKFALVLSAMLRQNSDAGI